MMTDEAEPIEAMVVDRAQQSFGDRVESRLGVKSDSQKAK